MSQTRRNKRPCPVCGGHGSLLYENAMAPLGGLDMSYTVEACLSCEAVFANNLATDAEYREYYSRFSKYDLAPVAPKSDTARIHHALAALVAKHVPIDAAVLDIGCGSGHLLSCLQAVGFSSLTGIDPAPNAASVAHEHYGLSDIRCGFLEKNDRPITAEKFDLVCLSAVLEHLTDPLAVLANVLENSAQGAWLALEVPDLDAFDGITGEPYGELSLEHINYFSERSLRLLLSGVGCETVSCEHIRHSYGGSLVVLARKQAGTQSLERTSDATVMKSYIDSSRDTFAPCFQKLLEIIDLPYVIYCAGSHTARLLPKLKSAQTTSRCKGIVDNNVNLHGVRIGEFEIQPISWLDEHNPSQVVVSSYKAREEIIQHAISLCCGVFSMYDVDSSNGPELKRRAI